MKKLLIIGTGGHGRVTADLASRLKCYEEIAFLDDHVTNQLPFPWLGEVAQFRNFLEEYEFIISIGNGNVRKSIYERIKAAGGCIATLIHPNAIVAEHTEIGEGSVILAGSILNTNAKLGKCVILNTASSVDHDCNIGDFVHIAVGAHICGTVEIGDNTWIGAGATVVNNISICADCMIGAGAVVIRNIRVCGIYMGIPAQQKKKCS